MEYSNGSRRAGTIEWRTSPILGTYEVFIPCSLPPELILDDELLLLISEASDALARLDGVTQVLPNPDLFVAMYMKKEALLSSQIEGTQASLLGILEFEADLTPTENMNDIREVLNYLKAMSHGMEKLEFSDFSLSLIT
jgi:Fic family protein